MPGRCGNRKGTWQEIVRCCLPPATSVVRLFRAVQTKCFVLKLRHPADDYLKARSPVACRATLPTAAKRRQDARGGWAIATDLAVGPTLGRSTFARKRRCPRADRAHPDVPELLVGS